MGCSTASLSTFRADWWLTRTRSALCIRPQLTLGRRGAARGCVLQMCGGEGAHHALRFAATRADGSHMVVSCQLQSGGHKSAPQLLPLCYLKSEAEQRADPLKDEDAAGDDKVAPQAAGLVEVDLLLAISPHEPFAKHRKGGTLNRLCVHIPSDVFCHHESVFLYEPIHKSVCDYKHSFYFSSWKFSSFVIPVSIFLWSSRLSVFFHEEK